MSSFIISLDFELFWGVRDVVTLEAYRANLLGVREAIPAMLGVFERRGIHVTWATVGILFCRTKRELEELLPARLPKYLDPTLSPYDLSTVGRDEKADPFHFAPSLVEKIAQTPGQEIGTHTFSHFYCLEDGQSADDFDADLASAQKVAAKFGVELRSIVFPRNQYNEAYRQVLGKRGLKTFRSSGRWPYSPGKSVDPIGKRLARLADSYVRLAGDRTFPVPRPDAFGLVDLPASAFLRPFRRRLEAMDAVKLRRITRAMTRAARNGETFHLWWHPHNFGVDLRENMASLETILDHFEELRRRHGMQSATMLEAAS